MRACSLFYGSLLVTQILSCGYVPPLEEDVSLGKTEYAADHGRGKYKAKSNKREWDWIRIKIAYDRSIALLSEKHNKIVRKLVLSARKYFQSTLKVQRLHTLQLRPSCAENRGVIYGSGLTECETDCKKKCGGAHAPGKAIYYSECKCKHGRCPSRGIWGGKLKHTDFLLFVTVGQASCGTITRAYAAHCSVDEQSKRPIAGYVNICPNALREIEEHGDAHWLATIKHELLHVFAFSTSLYPSFVGARKSSAKKGEVPGVLEGVVRRDWETASGFVPHEVKMIVTPRVREEARKYFNCPSVEGAEVENQGGGGSAGSHWEERLFNGEAMNAASDTAGAVSRLTLALLEDSGWYKPNYNKAEYMSWGLGRGCTFAKKSCLTWMKSHTKNPYPFCTTYEDIRCNENRLAKVLCDVQKTYVLPPREYDYNIKHLYHNKKGVPFYGMGLDERADYCPYYRIFLHAVKHHNKNGGDSRCTYSGNSNFKYTLEEFSPTARCFEISGKNVTIGSPHSYYYALQVGCYETSCETGHLMVKVHNSTFHQCNHKGQIIDEMQPILPRPLSRTDRGEGFANYVPGMGNVSLSIVCPPTNEVCEGNSHKIFRAPRDSSGYEKEHDLKTSALLMVAFLYRQI